MKNLIKISILSLSLIFVCGCSLSGTKSNPTAKATGSIWKSSDGGKTWTVKNKTAANVNSNIADANILSISINPYDHNNVFFGTKNNGIIKTTDGGETLDVTNFISEKVYGLSFDPMDGRVIYASGVWQKRGKIWKSTDGGENWTEIFTLSSDGPLVINLNIDRKNSNLIYISTSDNQVLKSNDAGKSWKNIFQASSPVLQTAIDSADSNLIYFNLQGGGIYRSKEGGINAESLSRQISKEADGNDFNFIETDPNNANWVYGVGSSGIVRSKDAGENWEKMMTLDNPQTSSVTSLSIKPGNSNEIIYTAARATYKSDDQGLSWTPFQLTDPKPAKVLEHSKNDPQIIYLGTSK